MNQPPFVGGIFLRVLPRPGAEGTRFPVHPLFCSSSAMLQFSTPRSNPNKKQPVRGEK